MVVKMELYVSPGTLWQNGLNDRFFVLTVG